MTNIESKIRALLNKAAGTTNTHEADAFHAKAEDLMAKHAISAGDLTEAERGEIAVETVLLDGPYVKRRLHLANTIAAANNCYLYLEQRQGSGYKRTTVGYNLVGHKNDRTITNLMFASIDLQMMRFMPPGSQRFRSAYIHSFTRTVVERVGIAKSSARREAGSGLVPLDGAAAMRRWAMKETGMQFTSSSTTIRANTAGSAAGMRAGSRADVGQSRMAGSSRALNR